MRPHKRFAGCVVEVALHEEVEEMGGIAADGAQLGVAALEDLVAEGGAHVGAAFEERAGKLQREGGGERELSGPRTTAWRRRALFRSLLHTL